MKVIITILFSLISLMSIGQKEYSGKIEVGYLKYGGTFIKVDPGPGWEGNYLNNEQNGIDLNITNGIRFNKRTFTGVGLGYLNFEGIHGLTAFVNAERVLMPFKISPLIGVKLGYNHIWNQYNNGTGTSFLQLGIGVNYSISEKYDLSIKTGIQLMQMAVLIPVNVGFGF
jgi:hypothetical protein